MPTSRVDAIALKHDINYVAAAGDLLKARQADLIALSETDWSLQGLAMQLGLTYAIQNNLNFSTKMDNSSTISKILQKEVTTNPKYMEVFEKYNVKLTPDTWI